MPQPYRLEPFQSFPFLELYTLRQQAEADDEWASESLAQSFFRRMRAAAWPELRRFLAILKYVGTHPHSVLAQHFLRHEAAASALPPHGIARWLGLAQAEDAAPDADESAASTPDEEANDILLRLYCYPADHQTLILFDGDRKTPGVRTAQECPQLLPHFRFAQKASAALTEARRTREWRTQGRLILPPDLLLAI